MENGHKLGSSVLVLGGTGFLGSRLTASLRDDGQNVAVIGAPTTPRAQASLGRRIAAAIRRHAPSAVFHLIGSGTPTPRNGLEYHVAKNVGTAQIVATALCTADFDGTLVFTSTGAVYGNTPVAARECTPPRPLTSHAWSKLEAERRLGDAAPRVVVARLFQVYGEGQRKLVVYDLARRIHLENGPLHLQSTGHETRDLAYVDDVAAALGALAADQPSWPPGAAIFNVASGVGIRIDTLARRLLYLAGQGHREVIPAPEADGNPLVASVGDPTKLGRVGITIPTVSDDTLMRTLEWTAAHVD